MKFYRKYFHWVFLVLFLTIGAFFFRYLYLNSEKKNSEAHRLKLINQHHQTIDQFTSSVDKFAGLVSGMRSYINLSPTLPSAVDFQQFVSNQYSDLKLQDSIVVSLIDTTHIFMQSFSRKSIDPINLVGRSVSEFRSAEELSLLDNLMTTDALRMFPPLNLAEGWVGLPINFRVHRNNKTIGYVAPVVSFKSILDDIYVDDVSEQFAFHFSTQEGFDFDREQTYNDTKVFNEVNDPEYYKNFNLDSSNFLYTKNSYYGFDIIIGTAYKKRYQENTTYNILLMFWYVTLAILATMVAWQVGRFRRLNTKLRRNNDLLILNRKEINEKNSQLQKLNDTQTKFFSIIGHDLKQPLSAIEGLVNLLQYEDIKDPDLAEIIRNLGKSTKNTTNLLNNLLRWARSQTGAIKFVPIDLNMNSILDEVLETLYFQAKEKSIKIVHQSQRQLMYHGDRDMLSTIFRNLISNAIKFSNPGGTITIETRRRNKSLEIAIKDSGIGMKPEEVDSLFKLDSQISTVGTSGEMGTGLGLILCHIFTKKHGGDIKIDSEIDRGTIFTVILPT